MHDLTVRMRARQLIRDGWTQTAVAAELHVHQSAVSKWMSKAMPTDSLRPWCWICTPRLLDTAAAAAYGYVLGQYLGDGHLVTSTKVPVLRIYSTATWPGITTECVAAVDAVCGSRPGALPARGGVVTVQSYSNHWPCVLPQHGPGTKHARPIALAPWQRDLVDADPRPLIRGLIHSDGCRSLNKIRSGEKVYSYSRYTFANESSDILLIYTDALDSLGIKWRANRYNSISVARRAEVAKLDAFVGPKS